MEVHFSVRLVMASNRNEFRTVKSWKTVRASNKVQWQSGDGLQTLGEHNLGRQRNEDREHDLLLKWCNREFPKISTDRGKFAKQLQEVIEDPESEKGLRDFADLLELGYSGC